MSQVIASVFHAQTDIPWLELIRTLAPVATAIIAFWALKNWQRQDRAKREVEFLDALIEASHSYIAELSTPMTLIEIAKIGMEAHAPTWEAGDVDDLATRGAVLYINKDGEYMSKKLIEALTKTQETVIKLRSLSTKGQVFDFKDYEKCQNAIAILTWQFDRMQAFAVFVGATWNWDNPDILNRLKTLMAMDPSEVRQRVQDGNVALIEFGGATYKRAYG